MCAETSKGASGDAEHGPTWGFQSESKMTTVSARRQRDALASSTCGQQEDKAV